MLDISSAINNGLIINKKPSKMYKFCVSQVIFFPLKFVEADFVSSITLSCVITESSIILAKYFPFLQVHVTGFQIYFFQMYDTFYICINIYSYSTFDVNYLFFHQIYIYTHMIYLFLQFLIQSFLFNIYIIYIIYNIYLYYI